MQILGSSILSSSQHQYSREETLVRSASERVVGHRAANVTNHSRGAAHKPAHTHAHAHAATHPGDKKTASHAGDESDPLQASLDDRLSLLKALVESLTGKEIKLSVREPEGESSDSAAVTAPAPAPAGQSPATRADNRQFETVTYAHYELSEYEYSSVNISGTLLLSNDQGEQLLDINLSVTMERLYQESFTELSVRQGRLTDPLVLNFNGDTVALSGQTTYFDLNSDGTTDAMPTLSSNSAYLALDKNGDGIINDGGELFGPASGNGFAELADYDQDGNGFIDAGDEVYTRLQLYRPDSPNPYQQSLASAGIGALYTGSVASPMQLTDADNNRLGQVRATGFYVNNNGSAGSIQQIDVVV